MEVGTWPSLAAADEHALVALAMGEDCRVEMKPGEFVLEVMPERVGPVRRELDLYREEQEPPRVVRERDDHARQVGWLLAIAWAAVLVAVHFHRMSHPAVLNRFSNDAEAIWDGHQWYRAFTALFFHADLGHLVGNIAIGGAFCLMVAGVLGAWRGWVLILLSGTIGNLLTDWLHRMVDEPFRSIGASTATFGALGLLVGAGMIRAWRTRRYRDLRPLFVPIAVGLALLGLYGTSGVNTDALGHLSGWLSGVVLGLLAKASDAREEVDPDLREATV